LTESRGGGLTAGCFAVTPSLTKPVYGVSLKITETNAVRAIITMKAENRRILRLPKNRLEKPPSA
jgi:hypothetical protein